MLTRRGVLTAVCATTAAAWLQAQSPADLDARIERDLPGLVTTYRALHAAPELSGHEEKTAAYVATELRGLGFVVTDHLGKYPDAAMTGFGVAGVLKNGAGPTVLIRTELDGLPVTEKTGLPFASTVTTKNADGQTVGVMHACGHDIHLSSFLGAARQLAAMKDRWHGTLIMLGQPAEETGNGADALIRDDLYGKIGTPTYVVSLHDSSDLEAGVIGYAPGFAMANIDAVDVIVRGVGGHGAMPDHTKDPVVLASQLVLNLQTIVSREISPQDPTVVTVGSIHGGTKRNVIPDDVTLQLTVRTYKKEVREKVLAAIQRMAKGLAMAAGLPDDRLPIVNISKTERGDALYNDPALTTRLAGVFSLAFGKDRVRQIAPEMVSEDVGHLGLDGKIPVLQFRVGTVAPATLQAHAASGVPLPALHSAVFAPEAEPAIRSGVKAFTLSVLELLR
jgi:hippurate hydrolase